MAEPLKNIYNDSFFEKFTIAIQQQIPAFDKPSFLASIFDKEWTSRELKQRMHHIVLCLKPHLPTEYKPMIQTVLSIVNQLQKNNKNKQSFEWMFLPEFVELYGLNDFKTSVRAFEQITQFTSCEFAVRPFIIKYPVKMMAQMLQWAKHENKNVRRFATEGCRPRLPWAMALPPLKNDPQSILPILEQLKNDPSEYVRRSVANNLNDIAKDNPAIVIEIAKKWIGKTTETDKLVKHACRTLLKQGNTEMMCLFGFSSIENIEITNFNIHTPSIKIGEAVSFSFDIKNMSNKPSLIRLEYGLYYQKANGTLSRKVFKISETNYESNASRTISRKQSFKITTTRKLHLGLHQIAIIVNGQEFDRYDFLLVTPHSSS